MIIRIWHGSTTIEDAPKYEKVLKELIFPGISRKNIPGYKGIQLLKNEKEKEVDFITIMAFQDIEAVKEFAGPDYEKSYVLDAAKKLLLRYDEKAVHYEVLYNNLDLKISF